MSPHRSLKVPSELLERDRLPELLDLLRGAKGAEVCVDLSAARRVQTVTWQLLLAAQVDGVRLAIAAPAPPHEASLRLLGLADAFAVEGS